MQTTKNQLLRSKASKVIADYENEDEGQISYNIGASLLLNIVQYELPLDTETPTVFIHENATAICNEAEDILGEEFGEEPGRGAIESFCEAVCVLTNYLEGYYDCINEHFFENLNTP